MVISFVEQTVGCPLSDYLALRAADFISPESVNHHATCLVLKCSFGASSIAIRLAYKLIPTETSGLCFGARIRNVRDK